MEISLDKDIETLKFMRHALHYQINYLTSNISRITDIETLFCKIAINSYQKNNKSVIDRLLIYLNAGNTQCNKFCYRANGRDNRAAIVPCLNLNTNGYECVRISNRMDALSMCELPGRTWRLNECRV